MATASLVVSVLALLASTAVAIRQVRLARGAARLSLSIDLLTRYLDGDLAESERIVGAEVAPVDHTVAIADLPEPVGLHARRVATLYQVVGFLAATGSVDRREARYFFGVNAVRAWRALEPHIRAQREQHPETNGYRFFEDLAARSAEIDAESASKRFNLKPFATPSRGSGTDLA